MKTSNFFSVYQQLRPFIYIIGTFAVLITIGAVLLSQDFASIHEACSFRKAFFTAVSAVCVTGLTVVNTAYQWSIYGQIVILILMQLGGLGIMVIATAILMMFQRGMPSLHHQVFEHVFDVNEGVSIKRLTLVIIGFTLLVELFGALLLFIFFKPLSGNSQRAFFDAVFHSVSSFCNAGFSTFPNGLMDYSHHLGVNLVITGLIILGSLGFIVVLELIPFGSNREKAVKSLHFKLAVRMNIFLYLAAGIGFFLFEFKNVLAHETWYHSLLISWFQSVTLRTAGHNTVDFGHLLPITLFYCALIMYIGASPGSTGGGIKTTTFYVFLLSILSFLRGRSEVEVFGRTIPKEAIYKTMAITAITGLDLVLALMVILYFEPNHSFLSLLFESISALATVGLSTGITSSLHIQSELALEFLMFVGRIGPLTFILIFQTIQSQYTIKYPSENIALG